MGMETGLIALAVFALLVLILLVKMASAKPHARQRRRPETDGLADELVPDLDD